MNCKYETNQHEFDYTDDLHVKATGGVGGLEDPKIKHVYRKRSRRDAQDAKNTRKNTPTSPS